MLVLTRSKHEQINVDGPCVITIVETRGDKVRVGIEAENSVNIWRSEIDPTKRAVVKGKD